MFARATVGRHAGSYDGQIPRFTLTFFATRGCAARYQVGALMEARPNGIIFGRKLIQMFWASVHSGDPGPIRYSNTRMRVVDEDTVTFCSDWTFNTMGGSWGAAQLCHKETSLGGRLFL